MRRYQYRNAPGLADLLGARQQADADRPIVAAVGQGDEHVVPDDQWQDQPDTPNPWQQAPANRTARAARITGRRKKGRHRR